MNAQGLKMKKILIVEDQADIRMLIKITLNFEQYEIHEASDVYMGLKMVEAIKPDLLILDIMLPTRMNFETDVLQNGLHLCQVLKKDPLYCHIPIILLTARGQLADREAGMQAGADEYLIKPFSPIHLIEVIQFQLSKNG